MASTTVIAWTARVVCPAAGALPFVAMEFILPSYRVGTA